MNRSPILPLVLGLVATVAHGQQQVWLVPAEILESLVKRIRCDAHGVQFVEANRFGCSWFCVSWRFLAKLIEQRFTSAMPARLEAIGYLFLLPIFAHGVLLYRFA
jgi:hypothetical protein